MIDIHMEDKHLNTNTVTERDTKVNHDLIIRLCFHAIENTFIWAGVFL